MSSVVNLITTWYSCNQVGSFDSEVHLSVKYAEIESVIKTEPVYQITYNLVLT